MSALRRARLADSADHIVRAARFRRPQRESFDEVVRMVSGLQDDLPELERAELHRGLIEHGFHVGTGYPDYQFALATGVGKRRLMGAIAAFLYASRQSDNVLILASRTTILEKLEMVVEPSSDDYLFLDPGLVPDPNVTTRGSLERFRPDESRLNVFILSPQSLAAGVRIDARGEFRDQSVLEYLRTRRDLVVLTDEAHHIGAEEAAWRKALEEIEPRLHFGFTATPRDDAHVLVSYDLAACLRDGLYTKAVDLLVKKRPDGVDDDDWDRATLEYALRRLDVKQAAIDLYHDKDPAFPKVRAVLLVGAANIAQADAVGDWLCDGYGLRPEEVYVAHSKRSRRDEEISDLLQLDRVDSEVRVVVHVQQLSEGWDVTNIYVIAPLRALATYQVALQTVGRGLRLPAGDRTGDPEVDTLEVVLFGKQEASSILEDAKKDFADPELEGSSLGVKDSDDVDDDVPETERQTIVLARSASIVVPVIRREQQATSLDLEIEVNNRTLQDLVTKVGVGSVVAAASSEDDGVSHEVEAIVANVRSRVCASRPFLSPPVDGPKIDKLTRQVLSKLDVDPDEGSQRVYVDPYRVAVLVGEAVDRERRTAPPVYKASSKTEVVQLHEVVVNIRVGISEPVDPREVADQ